MKSTQPLFFNFICLVAVFISIVEAFLLLGSSTTPPTTPLPFISSVLDRSVCAVLTFSIILLQCIFGALNLIFLDRHVIILIVLAAFGYDAFGYICGTWLGGSLSKSKPFPLLSAKKTWEGLFGGLLFSIIISLTYIYFLDPYQLNIKTQANFGVAIIGGLAACGGDLSCSLLKRLTGIKDSSNLLPGHGGFLDRFTSLFATATVHFVLSVILSANF